MLRSLIFIKLLARMIAMVEQLPLNYVSFSPKTASAVEGEIEPALNPEGASTPSEYVKYRLIEIAPGGQYPQPDLYAVIAHLGDEESDVCRKVGAVFTLRAANIELADRKLQLASVTAQQMHGTVDEDPTALRLARTRLDQAAAQELFKDLFTRRHDAEETLPQFRLREALVLQGLQQQLMRSNDFHNVIGNIHRLAGELKQDWEDGFWKVMRLITGIDGHGYYVFQVSQTPLLLKQ